MPRLYRGRQNYSRNVRSLMRSGKSEKSANAIAMVYASTATKPKRTPGTPGVKGFFY
jgi:hypothetical protein